MRDEHRDGRGVRRFACAAIIAISSAFAVEAGGCRGTYGLELAPCSELADCFPWPGTECRNGLCACSDGQTYCDNICKPKDACGFEQQSSSGQQSSEGGGSDLSACVNDSDCAQPDVRCGLVVCANNACVSLIHVGPTASQLRGDCLRTECDQSGQMVLIRDHEDSYDDGNPCTIDTCTAFGMAHEPLSDGLPCPGLKGVCGFGVCVACIADVDCGEATLRCHDTKECVPETCVDPMQNGGETDLNCGGSCAPCKDGASCLAANDCVSGVCVLQQCAAPTCEDGVKNGAETDVDCGTKECGKCSDGKRCTFPNDCASNVCWAGACQVANCFDGVKNNGEASEDCGGPCAQCP